MIKRTKLADRLLPTYTIAEERTNMITHIFGGAMGIIALVLCVLRAGYRGSPIDIVGAAIFGSSLILLYTMSSVYHGLKPGMGKKVLQIIDHCTIYVLIAGSYTPVVLSAIRPVNPVLAWGLFGAEWALALFAIVLTAIDLKKYQTLSMICYIGLGWGILPFMKTIWVVMTPTGFWLLLAGGISYTIGAVLYGIGSRRPWFHSVFHVFVVIGSALHILAILLYAL